MFNTDGLIHGGASPSKLIDFINRPDEQGKRPVYSMDEKRYESESAFPLMMLVMVSGCRTGEVQTPEDTGEMPYGEVGFAFFTPQALPTVVTKALIIDNEKGVSTFRTLDSTQSDPDVVGTWNSRTDDGGIQFNKVRHPPAQMLFCWDSVIDK